MKLLIFDLKIKKGKKTYYTSIRNAMSTPEHNFDIKGTLNIILTKNSKEAIGNVEEAIVEGEGFITINLLNTIPTPVLVLTTVNDIIVTKEKE